MSQTLASFAVLFFFLMIRRPPRSTLDRSSAASDVYKRQSTASAKRSPSRRRHFRTFGRLPTRTVSCTARRGIATERRAGPSSSRSASSLRRSSRRAHRSQPAEACLLYTSDAADERSSVDLGGRRIIKKKKKREREVQHTTTKTEHINSKQQ